MHECGGGAKSARAARALALATVAAVAAAIGITLPRRRGGAWPRAPPPQQLPAGCIYVVSLPQCAARRAAHAEASTAAALPRPLVHAAVDFANLSRTSPPLPILYNPRLAAPQTPVRAGQVACTASHRAVWAAAAKRNLSFVIVLEDDVTLTPSGARALPYLLRDADAGAAAHNAPWHYLFLRSTPVALRLRGSWHGSTVVAPPSWGTAAYALSRPGIAHMLSAVAAYEAPLDVTVAAFQRGAAATRLNALAPAYAARLTLSLPPAARGDCAFSATQAGWTARSDDFPCRL